MNDIKLIACDIDGTLLQPGQTAIAPAVFTQVLRLREKGIIFCPASGRQYDSLRRLFAPVADSVSYICENGAVIFGAGDPGPVLSKTVIRHDRAMALCHQILAHPDCEVLISGENTSYLIPHQLEYVRHIREDVGNNVAVVDAPEDVPEDIIKISMYCPGGVGDHLQTLKNDWSGELSVALGGKLWIDLTLADKGTGIRELCQVMNIPLAHVMAIGDNYNDLPILSIVGHPVIMENAASELKAQFAEKCLRVEDTLALL